MPPYPRNQHGFQFSQKREHDSFHHHQQQSHHQNITPKGLPSIAALKAVSHSREVSSRSKLSAGSVVTHSTHQSCTSNGHSHSESRRMTAKRKRSDNGEDFPPRDAPSLRLLEAAASHDADGALSHGFPREMAVRKVPSRVQSGNLHSPKRPVNPVFSSIHRHSGSTLCLLDEYQAVVAKSNNTQKEHLLGQLQHLSRLVMKQSQVLKRAMDELALHKSKAYLSRPLLDPQANIVQENDFLTAFASDTPCVVMSKKLMIKLADEEVEFYPQGSFFCNRAFATVLKVELGDISHPQFCHRDIGQWKYTEALRKSPLTPQNTRFVLNSGIRHTIFKLPLEDKHGNFVIMTCECRLGDSYAWMTYECADFFDDSFTVDGKAMVEGRSIEVKKPEELEIVRDIVHIAETSNWRSSTIKQ